MNIISRILDFLFPGFCGICGERISGGGELCGDCRARFARECFEHCCVCGKTASACACEHKFTDVTKTALDGRRFLTLTFYMPENRFGKSERVTERMIYRLKGKGEFAELFAEELSRPLMHSLTAEGEDTREWVITYPPRSTENFYRNGFDQSEMVAARLARKLGCKAERTMVRAGSRAEQKSLDREARRENAESTVLPIRRRIREGGKYILLDDIITSGATIEAAAALLYSAGAAAVFPVSIAMTMNGK